MRVLKLGVVAALGAGLALGGCAPEDTETELDDLEAEATGAMESTEDALDVDFSEWDLDTDQRLSTDEFEAWWDENGFEIGEDEEGADREAVSQRVHASWDTDDDGRVTEQEWREGTGADENGDWGTWADWDGDGDSELDLNEVREGMETQGVYERIDRDDDAILDDEELADWFFDLFDADDDEYLDTTEWDRRGAWRDDIGLDAGDEPETDDSDGMNR